MTALPNGTPMNNSDACRHIGDQLLRVQRGSRIKSKEASMHRGGRGKGEGIRGSRFASLRSSSISTSPVNDSLPKRRVPTAVGSKINPLRIRRTATQGHLFRAPAEGFYTPARCMLERGEPLASGYADPRPRVTCRSEWPVGSRALLSAGLERAAHDRTGEEGGGSAGYPSVRRPPSMGLQRGVPCTGAGKSRGDWHSQHV